MPYVRQHGNQLAIVHGARDPSTGKVEQQVLFTLYSQAEALEALGRGSSGGERVFQSLLFHHHPHLRFDWGRINAEIESRLDVLPEDYPYRAEKLRGRLRADLVALTRQLLLSDPQMLVSSADLIREQRRELQYLGELITWRLSQCEAKENEWNRDNPYCWRHRMQGSELPPEGDERIGSLFDKGDYDQVEALARLFLDCFPDYADGHNYLGLVALERERLEEAAEHFRRTIEVGRGLFPRRLARAHYWVDLSTRPYMRGMRNLALALNRLGRYDESLALCDQLEAECGDDLTASAYRADILLNLGRYEEARQQALRVVELWPDLAFPAAFASYELGDRPAALHWFLFGALGQPRSARMLVRRGARGRPQTHDEVRDHSAGVAALQNMAGHLARQSKAARAFFQRILGDPRVMALSAELEALSAREARERRAGQREAFDRIRLMRSTEFAAEQAAGLAHLVA